MPVRRHDVQLGERRRVDEELRVRLEQAERKPLLEEVHEVRLRLGGDGPEDVLRGVRLGVEVHEKRALSPGGGNRRQVGRDRGLAHAALLVENRETHRNAPARSLTAPRHAAMLLPRRAGSAHFRETTETPATAGARAQRRQRRLRRRGWRDRARAVVLRAGGPDARRPRRLRSRAHASPGRRRHRRPDRPEPPKKGDGLLFPVTLAAVAVVAIALLGILFLVFRHPAASPSPAPSAAAVIAKP